MKVVEGRLTFSATDLSAHAACAHLTELRLRQYLDGGEAEPRFEGPGTKALRERGLRHEREYLEHLRSSGREVLDLGFAEGDPRSSFEKIAEAIERTRNAVRDKSDVIAQARFQSDRWGGSADMLLWNSERERYEIVDTKLSRETKGGTILQLLVYAELLDELAGQQTERVGVVAPGRDFEVEWHRVKEYDAYFRLAKMRLLDAIEKRPSTYPEPVEHCALCNWWQRCDRQRHGDDHLSLVASMTRGQRREAVEHGLPTLEGFAEHDVGLWNPARGSRQALQRSHRQARVQLEGRRAGKPLHELLPRDPEAKPPVGLGMLPEPDAGDLFFDIEGDRFAGDTGLEYLFGTVDAEGQYVDWWAMDAPAERAMLEAFIDEVCARIVEHPGAHVYHFGHYEVSALKRLAQRYGTREHELDGLLRSQRFVDLLRVVKTALIASVEGYSIKLLEPLYGFERNEDLELSREYRRQLEIELEQGTTDNLPEEMLLSITEYNKDDCESTKALRGWLEALRSALVTNGEEIPRPVAQEPDGDRPREPELQALIDRLLDGVPKDPTQRDVEQQARATLAALTEYHHREMRNAWWEFIVAFDREDESEHLDAANTIGGLTFIEELPREGKQRNKRLRCSFPEQRLDVRTNDQAFWAMDFQDGVMGAVEDVDKDAGQITFSVKPERAHLRPSFVVIAPQDIFGNLEKAIRSVASNVVGAGFDGSAFPAAVDLLLRRFPTLAPGVALASRTDDVLRDACRFAAALEHGVLAVQGPPGTGKTFTGAHLVAELVAKKQKVGVCALSHAAIAGMLRRIALESKHLRVLHVGRDCNLKEALSRLAKDEVDVVGATSFAWCREEVRGTVDTLVIDEAGQLSLADGIAASTVAARLVMLGDPQQLKAPQQGAHPEGAAVAALEHFIGDRDTISDDLGLFLDRTRRLSGPIVEFISDLFYNSRLEPFNDEVRDQVIHGASPFAGAGMHVVTVEHQGNQSSSPEEVEAVARLAEHLSGAGLEWACEGKLKALSLEDLLIVAPYNAQVNALRARIPAARVGTVDKFQGQEAPVVIISLATSTPEDAPRGMEFLYSRNRLNVATSRARCVVIIVCSSAVLEPECRTPKQMRLANGYAALVEAAGG